jgi:hypothetical protein
VHDLPVDVQAISDQGQLAFEMQIEYLRERSLNDRWKLQLVRQRVARGEQSYGSGAVQRSQRLGSCGLAADEQRIPLPLDL